MLRRRVVDALQFAVKDKHIGTTAPGKFAIWLPGRSLWFRPLGPFVVNGAAVDFEVVCRADVATGATQAFSSGQKPMAMCFLTLLFVCSEYIV